MLDPSDGPALGEPGRPVRAPTDQTSSTLKICWVWSRCVRVAPRSLVKTTTPRCRAGQVLLPWWLTWEAPDQPLSVSRVAVKTFHRQSVERESYQTARIVPSGSTPSLGRWLIASAFRATCSNAVHVDPPSVE